MQKTLVLFNPENDIALANGGRFFTADKMARKIRHDLQMLPLWYACGNSAIFAENSEVNKNFLELNKNRFPQLNYISLYQKDSIERFLPWGWSPALLSEFKTLEGALLPEDKILNLRDLSHRRSSIQLLQAMGYEHEPPVECFNFDDVGRTVTEYGKCVAKTPWSSSGRGVFIVDSQNSGSVRSQIEGAIKRQGSIIIEKFQEKTQDFAMEFKVENGIVRFIGYSVFSNDNFSYKNAIVGSTALLEGLLSKKISQTELLKVKQSAIDSLTGLIPAWYNGFCGLDMMILKSGEIIPCVELNLRTTMGHVSSIFGNNFLGENKVAQMSILYHRSHEDLERYIQSKKPPIVENGRLVAGSLFLTPIYSDSLYSADITI